MTIDSSTIADIITLCASIIAVIAAIRSVQEQRIAIQDHASDAEKKHHESEALEMDTRVVMLKELREFVDYQSIQLQKMRQRLDDVIKHCEDERNKLNAQILHLKETITQLQTNNATLMQQLEELSRDINT